MIRKIKNYIRNSSRPSWQNVEGSTSLREITFLRDLASRVVEGCILEVGSFRGRSTCALSEGAKDGVPIFAIDPHEEFEGALGGQFGPQDRKAFYQNMLMTGAFQNVRLVNLSSEVVAPMWDKKIQLLWLDGDHSYEGVKRDFEVWKPHLAPTAVVAFHDSTDKDLGPYRFIQEVLATGEFKQVEVVHQITTIVANEE